MNRNHEPVINMKLKDTKLFSSSKGNPSWRGFTLVELMVAMTIGLIVLAAVAKIFATSRTTYGLEENLARVQENGRFAMEFLAQDIRMAGYTGCSGKLAQGTITGGTCPSGTVCSIVAGANNYNTLADPSGIQAFMYTGTTGTALSDWTPNLPSAYFAAGEVVAGTDVIVIQRGDTLSTHLTGNTTPINANIQILDTSGLALAGIQPNDVLMVTDCNSADIFKANNISSGSGKITIAQASVNTQNTLTHYYDTRAELMKLVTRAYYIGNGTSKDKNGNPIPALMRKELISGGALSTAQELVEGIQGLRLVYGEDTDTPPDNVANVYRNPGSVANMRNVVSVRVWLLVRTLSPVGPDTDTKTYTVPDVSPALTYGPYNDTLRRRVFNATVRVRNH